MPREADSVSDQQETNAWMERMDQFRTKLRSLKGRVPEHIQHELLAEFEDIMTDMRIAFGRADR